MGRGIGWVWVGAGAVPERMFVGHVQRATHFMAAVVFLGYTLWFALSLSVPASQVTKSNPLRKTTVIIFCILFFQLIYGAFMAGLHAATAAPTWPQINGQWFPAAINTLSPGWKNFIDNKITIQLIHRGIAYILLIAVFIWYFRAKKIRGSRLFTKTRLLPLVVIILQVVLGITTVITSPYGNNLVWFGVAHQLVAILFLMTIIFMLYIIRSLSINRQ